MFKKKKYYITSFIVIDFKSLFNMKNYTNYNKQIFEARYTIYKTDKLYKSKFLILLFVRFIPYLTSFFFYY